MEVQKKSLRNWTLVAGTYVKIRKQRLFIDFPKLINEDQLNELVEFVKGLDEIKCIAEGQLAEFMKAVPGVREMIQNLDKRKKAKQDVIEKLKFEREQRLKEQKEVENAN